MVNTNQKEDVISLYKREDIAKYFDKDREESKFEYQKYKNNFEATIIMNNLINIAKNKKEIKVLDVGCGTGRLLQVIFNSNINSKIEYLGLDTSKSMLKRLEDKAKKMNITKKIRVVVADATKMPIKDNSFDFVFTYHLLWHLPIEIQNKIIKEMIRVAKNNSIIIFDVLNEEFFWEKIKPAFRIKKTNGIYKRKISEIINLIGNKKIKMYKLSDFPIEKDFIYRLANIINRNENLLPPSFFHMLYFLVKK